MNNKLKGCIFLLTSTIIYGLFGLFSRFTGKFQPFSQGWVRYAIILSIIFIFFIFKKVSWKKIRRKDLKWFLLWILPASFQPILTFISFNHLPLGITYFLLYSTMILGGILSGKIFFSEKFGIGKMLSLIFVLIGLFVIYKSDISLIKSIYVFLALVSGLIVGFWNTLSKKVSGNYSEFQLVFLDSLSTFSIGLAGFFATKEMLPSFVDVGSWFWIFIFALSNIVATFLLIRGFKYVEAQVGSFILPMEVVFASSFGYLFFGEILKLNVYIGGLLIFLAAILPTYKISKNN